MSHTVTLLVCLTLALSAAIWFAYYAYYLREQVRSRAILIENYIKIAQDEAAHHAATGEELQEFRYAAQRLAVSTFNLLADLKSPKVMNRLPVRFLPLIGECRKAAAAHDHFVSKWKRPETPAS